MEVNGDYQNIAHISPEGEISFYAVSYTHLLNDLAFNYKVYGLPCFETIRRARQRVQSLFPEYSRNAEQDDMVIIIGIL